MDLRRVMAAAVISVTGLGLAGVAVSSLSSGVPGLPGGIIVGAVLVLGGAFAIAGPALYRSSVTSDHLLRVAGWNTLGVVVTVAVLALVGTFQAADGGRVAAPLLSGAVIVGVSAFAHVLIGVNDVRRIRVGELARERQKLAVLNRIVRHNLRNDAQVLLGNAEALLGELDDDRHRGMADSIAGKATSLASMNEKLGKFQAAIEHDPSDERAVDLDDLIESVVEELRESFPEATIETDVPAGLAVEADDKLGDALSEAIENAILHGGGEVRVGATRHGGDVDITVTDEGPGIPEHELSSIAADAEITQLDHGTGVGLWVLRTVVEAYDGTLSIDTDDGTTVTIRLPAA